MLLSSLLPGLRHLRTPLMTGYLYFLAVWLVLGFDRLVPQTTGATVWERHLAALTRLIGVSGTAAALTLAAYLFGSMLVVGSNPFARDRYRSEGQAADDPLWLRDLRSWALTTASRVDQNVTYGMLLGHPDLGHAFKDELGSAWNRVFSEDRDRNGAVVGSHNFDDHRDDPAETEVIAAALSAGIREEFDLLAIRLQIERESLWNDYDRLRSESELRYSISIPLMLIAVITGITWYAWAFFGLLLPGALLIQALRTERRAKTQIWTAVLHGVIESPTVVAIRKMSNTAPPKPPDRPDKPEFPERRHTFSEAVVEAIYFLRAPRRARELTKGRPEHDTSRL